MNETKRFLNHQETMELTGFGKSKLDKLRMNKAIPYIKNGRSVIYDRLKIEEWLTSQSIGVL